MSILTNGSAAFFTWEIHAHALKHYRMARQSRRQSHNLKKIGKCGEFLNEINLPVYAGDIGLLHVC